MEAVYVNAGNDASGNPRRGWVLIERGLQLAFVDEGYEGSAALRAAVPKHVYAGAWGMQALRITPGQYRDLLRLERILTA